MSKFPLREAMLAGFMKTETSGDDHCIVISFETLEEMQEARKALYHAILPQNAAGQQSAASSAEPAEWRWKWTENGAWVRTEDVRFVPKSAPFLDALYLAAPTPSPDAGAVREALDEAVTLLMDAQCEHPSGARSANWHTRRRHLLKTSKPVQAREAASTLEMPQWVERDGAKITLWLRNKSGTHLRYSVPIESSEGDVLVDLEATLASSAPVEAWQEPTNAQLSSACMSYRHDYGLLDATAQQTMKWQAKEWLIAWRKEGFGCDRDEVIERCAAVVDRANKEGPYQAIAAAPRIRALKGGTEPRNNREPAT